MTAKHSSFGLILCGGDSARMGADKCFLTYHDKPQCYHLYDRLQEITSQAFISCNRTQSETLDHRYPALTDLDRFGSIGPMAGLLTAFHHFPDNDFLVIGCDYPFLKKKDILDFINLNHNKQIAAAFYNRKEEVYEPLLAWYSRVAASMLTKSFNQHQYSLQHFLREANAEKFEPADPTVMVSIDTPEAMQKAKEEIRKSEMLNAFIWS